MRKHFFAGILTLILSIWFATPFCYASSWEYVCSGKDGTRYFLDSSTVEKQGAYLYFWRRGVHLEIQDGEREFYSYHEVHLDNSLEGRILKSISYDDNDNVIRNHDAPTRWQSLRRGSIIYTIANAAMHYVR